MLPQQIAKDFLSSWFRHVEGGFFQLTYIRDGRVATSCYPIDDGFDIAVEEAARRNANGDHCYIRVAPISRIPPSGDRGDESFVSASPGMWAEVDVLEAGGHKQTGQIAATFVRARQWIDALPVKPTIIVHSGGGYHLYWRSTEPRDFSRGDWLEGKSEALQFEAALQKRAAEFGFGLDTNITRNFACLLRLPGMVNWKRAAGHTVTIEEMSEREYEWQTFADAADLTLGGESAESYVYPQRQGLASPGSPSAPRGRNDTLKAMTAACLSNGKNVHTTVQEIVSYDLHAHDPPLFMDPTEPYSRTSDPYVNALGFVQSIMQSIQRQAEAAGRTPDYGNSQQTKILAGVGQIDQSGDPFKNVRAVSFDEAWIDRSPYEPHLVQTLIPKSTLTVIAGPPKSQKSFMLLDLSVKLALGIPWFGFAPLRPLRVMLIQFEMPFDMMRARVHGIRPKTGFSPVERDRLRRNFVYSDRAVAPFNRDSFPHYLNFIRRNFPDPSAPPDVIVFDPLGNMYDGNESSNAEMFVFLRLLDDLRDQVNPDAGVILLHHANKTNRREMLEDPFNALRGASALRGYYTSAVFVVKGSEKSETRTVYFDNRAGISPHPKQVDLIDGEFIEADKRHVEAGESQLDAWNAERRRQRDRILLEINRRARHNGELYALKELSEVLESQDDLPGARRIRELLSQYATRGYIRFCDGTQEDLGLAPLDGRSMGYVVTEITEIVDLDYGEIRPVHATHYKDQTNGLIVALDGKRKRWTYDDDDFELTLIDPDSNVFPFKGRKP